MLDLRGAEFGEGVILSVEQLTIDGTRATLALSSKVSQMPADGGSVCTQIGSGSELCKPVTTLDEWYREANGTPMTGTAQRGDTAITLDFPR